MVYFVTYLIVSITFCTNLIRGIPTLTRTSNSIVQPEELKPGKDYSHFMYKRDASPEPHGGGGHGGGGGGGHGGGFGGGHGGFGGGFGGHPGVGHYGGGFGGRPVVGVGLGGFIPAPIYRPRPYGYGYGYGRYRRSLDTPQLPHVSIETQNIANTSTVVEQPEFKSDFKDITNKQIQRDRNERNADTNPTPNGNGDYRDRFTDYDGYGIYQYRNGYEGSRRYPGFYGGSEALVFPVGNVPRPGYGSYGYNGPNQFDIEV